MPAESNAVKLFLEISALIFILLLEIFRSSGIYRSVVFRDDLRAARGCSPKRLEHKRLENSE